MIRSAHLVRTLSEHWRWLALLVASGTVAGLAIAEMAAPATLTAIDRWGVDQLRIHRTAEGHMLDLRYRVVDSERAESLLAKTSTAYLVHSRSGRRLAVPSTPKAGALRTTTGHPQTGRSYFALFSNPGKLVQRGDQVSVVLGDLNTTLSVE